MNMPAYSSEFFSFVQSTSVASADIVVPHVLRLFSVSSAVDFGCGTGSWLASFQRHGVRDVLGLDGDYVPRDRLEIDAASFVPTDLVHPKPLDRTFDLACSLEVAEHLPEKAADRFVAALVAAAPVALFSAAIPEQGGTHHVNEQWQSYWAEKFAGHGMVAVDCIRPHVHRDPNVAAWYRQNTIVYCRPEHVPAGYRPASTYDLDRIDQHYMRPLSGAPTGGRQAVRYIRSSVPVLGKAMLRQLTRR